MLLRRFTEHVRDQNWFAVALDFFVVVLGVFVGIQVDGWNQGRLDRQQERAYLVRLHADVMDSTRLLDIERDQINTMISDMVNIIEALDACTVPPDKALSVQRGFNWLAYLNPPPLIRRTIDEMAASGRLDVIQSSEVKAELSGIVAALTRLEDLQRSVERLTDPHRISLEAYLRYDFSADVDAISQLPVTSVRQLPVTYDIEALCELPNLANTISAIGIQSRDRILSFDQLREQYINFLPLLEEELQTRWGYEIGEAAAQRQEWGIGSE